MFIHLFILQTLIFFHQVLINVIKQLKYNILLLLQNEIGFHFVFAFGC